MDIQDPFTYVAKVKRGDDGRVVYMEVIYREQTVTVEDGDEFVTFTTVIDLATPPLDWDTV